MVRVGLDGLAVYGGVDRETHVDGVVPPELVHVRAGWWSELDADRTAGLRRLAPAGLERSADGVPERWELAQRDRRTGVVSTLFAWPDDRANCNVFGCGGGRWYAGGTNPAIEVRCDDGTVIAGAGLYQADGAVGYGMVGRDGVGVVKPRYYARGGIRLVRVDRPDFGEECVALAYNDGLLVYTRAGVPRLLDLHTGEDRAAAIFGGVKAIARGRDGLAYLVEWQESADRTVVHRYDVLRGYVIGQGPHDFNADAAALPSGVIRVATSWGAGERPNEWRDARVSPVSSDGLIDLTLLPLPPLDAVPVLERPLGVAVYCVQDVQSPGHYTIPVRPTQPVRGTVVDLSYFDSTTIPIEWLRAQPRWRPVGFPCYRQHGEDLPTFKSRCEACAREVEAHGYTVAPVLGLHSGWIGDPSRPDDPDAGERYRSEREVAEGVIAFAELVDELGWRLVAVFEAGRGTLPDGAPDVLPSAWRYFGAFFAGVTGPAAWPTAPVDVPAPPRRPPPPDPLPPPAPPAFVPSSHFLKESPVKVALVRPRVFRVDPTPLAGADGDARWPVHIDRDTPGPHEEAELEKRDDGFTVKFTASSRYLSLTPEGRWETRAAAGAWETFLATEQPDGLLLLYRRDDARLIDVAVMQELAA